MMNKVNYFWGEKKHPDIIQKTEENVIKLSNSYSSNFKGRKWIYEIRKSCYGRKQAENKIKFLQIKTINVKLKT